MRLKNAEKHYREALKIDPSLVEARLRLGRVLQQRGLMQDARNELEAVFSQPGVAAGDSLSRVDLSDRRPRGAGQHRGVARAGARSRHALSRVSVRASGVEPRARGAGPARPALAALAPLWKEEGARACADPWWSYYLGQAWRMPKLFESLRDRVRGAK